MLLLIALLAVAQSADRGFVPPSMRMQALEARVNAGDTHAVEAFWKSVARTPLVEDIPGYPDRKLITFLYRGDASTKNVVVMSELGGYTNFAANMMRKVMGADVWYLSYVVRDDARFTYFLAPNDPLTPLGGGEGVERRLGAWKNDPLNPNLVAVPGRMASYVEMPNALKQPFVARRDDVERGKVELHRFRSSRLSNERQLAVYTPPGYSTAGERYPLLILLDGVFYTFFIPAPVILDNMIADGEIRAPVMVVVDTLFDRDRELSCNPSFTAMLADELLPWIRARYHVTARAEEVVAGGSSFGGLAAACAGFARSDAIGGVIAQSGSFWWAHEGEPHGWLRRQIHRDGAKPVRFYLDAGLMETSPSPGEGPDMLTATRQLFEALRAQGYDVTLVEFNGGHEFLNWRGTLSGALKLMFK